MNKLQTRFTLIALLPWLALPAPAFASSGTALKRYEKGKYESALREYKRLLTEKPDEPRLHFNAGAAAFQVNDFEEALKQLNASLVTQDLPLQQRAYYNLGNTEYRLGEETHAPDKKQTHWEQAIANYDSALKLNSKDEDAKFNRELVKQKLEELQKQQQQQQSKEDQKDQNKQDEKSKPDQNKQEQNKSEQQKPQPDQKQENQKPEENQAQNKPESPKQEKQEKQENKQAESKHGNESKDNKPDNSEEQQGQAKGFIARMTPKEAQQLLDAQKADEKAMIFTPKAKPNPPDRVFKDW